MHFYHSPMQDFFLPSSSFQHDLILYLSPLFQPLFLLLFPPKLASALSFLLSFMNTHPLFCAPSAIPYLLSSLSCTLPLSLFLVFCMNLAPSSSLSICSILSLPHNLSSILLLFRDSILSPNLSSFSPSLPRACVRV